MALGLWGMVGAAGAALGPLISGALLAHFWWGSAFLINVPVMLIVLPLVFLLLPRTEQTTPGNWGGGAGAAAYHRHAGVGVRHKGGRRRH